jgi:hypothetical protein
MFDCNKLLHPFQNDPGTSQRQRIIDELLSDSAQIDGRSLAELLNYFTELSAGINYYDKNLHVSDWRPFFDRSLPFLLSSISKCDINSVREKFELYTSLFNRNPSASGLQLVIYFIYYNIFSKIDHWYSRIIESDLPVERYVDELIRTRMADHLKQFIALSNEAANCFKVRRPDFMKFVNSDENDAWNLTLPSIYSVSRDCDNSTATKCDKLKDLFERVILLFPSLLESLRLITTQAEGSIKLSMIPDGKELSKNHPPHLALVFAFISLFQKMQGELNKKKREHLQFFYTEVLKIKPAEAQADKAFVVFELQKLLEDQYEKFRVKKGVRLNAGRDEKNVDLLFETDDEIVVNEAQVVAFKTLYLNNKTAFKETFVEGAYMAPDATMSDGVDKAFREDPRNWYTVGNKFSKYIEPGKRDPKAYPFARLGFVLASPVLYLAEGKRTATIMLACKLDAPCDAEHPELFDAVNLYKKVRHLIGKKFYVITEDLIQAALDKGIPENVVTSIRNFLPDLPENGCYEKPPLKEKSIIITEAVWRSQFFNALPDVHKAAVSEIFVARRIFRIHLSGAEEWIEPTRVKLVMEPLNMVSNTFTLKIKISLKEDKPSVTFYNKDILKEDLGTTLPLVKIELDDEIKILRGFEVSQKRCCLLKDFDNSKRDVSFYHFFRNVRVVSTAYNQNTRIDVKVCGLKNFVVQNDENVMDVNSPIYPFGTRPDVTDFDMVNPVQNPPPDVEGPNFFLGSKEIFCKKWTSFQINVNWKDRPLDFQKYYTGYLRREIPSGSGTIVDGLREEDFEYRLSFLMDGEWKAEAANRRLFPDAPLQTLCTHNNVYAYSISVNPSPALVQDQQFNIVDSAFGKHVVSTRNGFIKLNLRKQDFGHRNYPFILARQMMAFGKLPKDHVEGAIYYDQNNDPIVLSTTDMLTALEDAGKVTIRVRADVDQINVIAGANNHNITFIQSQAIRAILRDPNTPLQGDLSLVAGAARLDTLINDKVLDLLTNFKDFQAIIPNEPWTPIISNIALDYTATADLEDIDLIHLYPFAGTNKEEQIELEPTLFPTCCDEGTLFIGLSNFQPGSNLNLLFQLAEATADSESQTQPVKWSYLDSNIWKELRYGFEVLKDGTNNLTASGIVQLALPENMTIKNSVMPKNLHWIKASVARNSRSVCETIGIHAQAVSATFKMSDANDKSRLGIPLEAGKIEKLLVAQPSIKSVAQPYESFGGKLSELDSSYHLRVSEHLRHKGRAIQKWDYERLVLEKFPLIYKTKCINHSFKTDAGHYENDVPYAPGYVILGVMPDLTKLKSGNSYEPRVPVSLLEEIDRFVSKRTSPFVRFKAANPRYEKVDFCITVRLTLGADPTFYKAKLRQDVREFMAPWAIGKYDKFSFGQCVYRSDVLQLLEGMDYIDFIKDLRMAHEKESTPGQQPKVCPLSPRSILIAGNIDILIDDPDCDSWCEESANRDSCKPAEVMIDYCRQKKG